MPLVYVSANAFSVCNGLNCSYIEPVLAFFVKYVNLPKPRVVILWNAVH